jgi:preprotein translocase subunit SecG
MSTIFAIVLTVLSIFLILLVLVQRGRGGGLTGALGGMGGSSAFGAKAGDVFTRITIVTAAIWIAVCIAAVYWANNRSDRLGSAGSDLPWNVPAADSTTDDAAGDADAGTSSPAAETGSESDSPADDAN